MFHHVDLSSSCSMVIVRTLNHTRFNLQENIKLYFFCLPPHTTHECQPLDTSFFRSFKSHWQNSVHKFYQDYSRKSVSILNFCSVFNPAWLQASTPANLINGFKKTGIYPFNRQAIKTTGNEGGH